MTITAKDVSARIDTHEAVCAERWKETIERIKRLEMILIGACGAALILMAGLLWKMQPMIELFNAAWPVLLAIVGLIVVLAKMHGDLEVLKDKVRVLFDLLNAKRK